MKNRGSSRPGYVSCAAMAFHLIFLAMPPDVAAQKKGEAAAGEKKKTEEALKHNEAGIKLYSEGKYSEAVKEFEESYKLVTEPEVLYNIARCHHLIGEYLKALELYEKYISSPGALEKLQQAKAFVGEIMSMMPRVKVESDPPGAHVYLDDSKEHACVTPGEATLKPGKHSMAVKMEGYKDASKDIEVEMGKKYELKFSLEKAGTGEKQPEAGKAGKTGETAASGKKAVAMAKPTETKVEKHAGTAAGGRRGGVAGFVEAGAGGAIALYFPEFDTFYPDVILLGGVDTKYITVGARLSIQPWSGLVIYDAGLMLGKIVRLIKKLGLYAGVQIGVMIMDLKESRVSRDYTMAEGTGWDLSVAAEGAVVYNFWKALSISFSPLYFRMYPSAGNIDKKISFQYAPSIRLSARF